MGLSEEIKDNEKTTSTTEMKMSIGEIINLYKDEDIIIKPEFQRFFRWKIDQKSRLIESILIGIPIPSIFVQQIDDGRWEIIDGLQRISTILEFVGILKDENGKLKEPSRLSATKFLPSLQKMMYECSFGSNMCFDRETKLIFKRTPIIIQIVKRDSNFSSKYELFDRLNSGGSPVTNQELRNAIYLQEKHKEVKFLKDLSNNQHFKKIINLSDKQIEEAYDQELVLRFFAYNDNKIKITSYGSLKDFLDNYIHKHLNEDELPCLKEKFEKLFKFLDEHCQANLFKRKNRNTPFKVSIFEAVTIGLYDIDDFENIDIEKIKTKIQNLDQQSWFVEYSKQGSQTKQRIEAFIKNSKPYFKS